MRHDILSSGKLDNIFQYKIEMHEKNVWRDFFLVKLKQMKQRYTILCK